MVEQRIVLADGKVLGRFVARDGYEAHRAAIQECKRLGYSASHVWIDAPGDSGRYGHPVHYDVDACPVVQVGRGTSP